VGLATHAARLLRESENRLDHLSTLIKAAQFVSAELRLDTVLQRLVGEVTSLLDADAADCYLHDADRGIIRCVAVHGLDPDLVGFESPREHGLAGVAFRERRSVVSHDYERIAEDFPNPAYESFKSALVAPMTVGDEVLGMLGVGSRDPERRFDQADREAIEAFAGLATLAIQHAASFEERERRSRIERGFFLVASALAQPLSLEETVDAVAQAASEALGGSFAAVLMPDGEALRLVGRHHFRKRSRAPSRRCRTRSRTAAPEGWSSPRRTPAPTRAWTLPGKSSPPSASARCSPSPLAPTAPPSCSSPMTRSFTDDDLVLAGHLADAAKGALERGRLFERERSARRLSQQLARIGTFLATELDPRRVVAEVAAEAPELLGTDAAAIRLVEEGELVVRAGEWPGGGGVRRQPLPARLRPGGRGRPLPQPASRSRRPSSVRVGSRSARGHIRRPISASR
jgi:GAF domain-containing protein